MHQRHVMVLSGAPRVPGRDPLRGGFWKYQPPRQVLLHHAARLPPPGLFSPELGATFDCHGTVLRHPKGATAMNDSLLAFFSRLRAFFFKTSLDHDFDDELAAHIELLTAENVHRGITPEEARRAAFIKLGGVDPAKELHRDTRSLPFLHTLLHDLHHTFRTLPRDIGFTTFAILI